MSLSPFRGGRGFWDPLSEVNRMFDDMFGGLARRPGGQQRGQLTEWAPAVDVLQRDGDLVVRAELPGVRPEDVDITLQDNVLTLSGERREEQEEQRGGYYVRERRRGSFSRSMTLPEGVDEDTIRARYENGVLEVTLTGAAAVREPRRIQVEAGESPMGTEGPGARTEVSTSAETTRPVAPGAAPEPRDVPPRTAGIEEGASHEGLAAGTPRREETFGVVEGRADTHDPASTEPGIGAGRAEPDSSPRTEPSLGRGGMEEAPPRRTSGVEEGALPRREEPGPSRPEEVPMAEEVPSGTPPQAPPGDVQRETPPEPSSRTEEPGPLGRESSRRPEREQDEEDKGLLDRARDALLGEEDEPRRREGTDRPDRR